MGSVSDTRSRCLVPFLVRRFGVYWGHPDQGVAYDWE
jgi:hypothetical protein